jgi:hypothetical protein
MEQTRKKESTQHGKNIKEILEHQYLAYKGQDIIIIAIF